MQLCQPKLTLDLQTVNARLSKLEEQLASGAFTVKAAAKPADADDEERPPFPDDADDPFAGQPVQDLSLIHIFARQRDVLAHDFFDRIALDECIEKRLWEWHGSGPPFRFVNIILQGPMRASALTGRSEMSPYLPGGGDENFGILIDRVFIGHARDIVADDALPVSYTHLDVYKRQS